MHPGNSNSRWFRLASTGVSDEDKGKVVREIAFAVKEKQNAAGEIAFAVKEKQNAAGEIAFAVKEN